MNKVGKLKVEAHDNPEGLKEWVLENVIICARKISDDDTVVKCRCMDLELYFNILIDSGSGTIFSSLITQDLGFSVDDLIGAATKNMWKISKVQDYCDILGIENSEVELYAVTNKFSAFGAGFIFCNEMMHRLCQSFDTNGLIIIPSSVHEILVVPDRGDLDLLVLNPMIANINSSIVVSDEVLSDHAYYYNDDFGGVTWDH